MVGPSQKTDLIERLMLDTYEANKNFALELLCAPQLGFWTLVFCILYIEYIN